MARYFLPMKKETVRRFLILSITSVTVAGIVEGQTTREKGKQNVTLSSSEMRNIAFDFIHALDSFFLTVHNSEPSDPVEVMSTLMIDINRFDEGIALIQKYQKHTSEPIRVAAEGTVLGATIARDSDRDFIQQLRRVSKTDPDEFRYQVATYRAKQKEAYELIARSAPWITAAMFEFRDAEDRKVQFLIG